MESGLYHSITDIVEAMNTLIQERHNYTETSIAVRVSRRTQVVEIHLASERSGLAFFSMDLGQLFGCTVGKDFGVLLRGKGPHKPVFAYGNVRLQSLMIDTVLIEYKFNGDIKTALLCWFPFFSKLKTTEQHIIYQTFSNLQFRTLIRKFFSWYSHRFEKHKSVSGYYSTSLDV